MYRSYRLYLGKLETEKKHAEQVSNLHLRTIEALALAIEAKDETTGEHLQRVRVVRDGTAEDLGLSDGRDRSVAGCLGVCTTLEIGGARTHHFEAGKTDARRIRENEVRPIVGDGILEQVHFPYPSGTDCARPA